MRSITKHIIHCSDSSVGNVKAIRAWHLARNFRDVGYHFIIRRDGEVEVGRMMHEKGAHCLGHNHDSIGTCLVGKKNFTLEQIDALKRVETMLQQIFPNITTHGHNEFTKYKTCPNFDVQTVLRGIL